MRRDNSTKLSVDVRAGLCRCNSTKLSQKRCASSLCNAATTSNTASTTATTVYTTTGATTTTATVTTAAAEGVSVKN